VEVDGLPKMKVTSDIVKATLPGKKRVLRAFRADGGMLQDVICVEQDELSGGDTVYAPSNPLQNTTLPIDLTLHELRQVVMKNGIRTGPSEPLSVMDERSRQQLASLPEGCQRLINPHRYKVSISGKLHDLRNRLVAQVAR